MEQVLLAVGFLLAAVVLFLVVLVLGPADGSFGSVDGQQTQLRNFPEQRFQVRRSPGRQQQFLAQRLVDQRGKHPCPVADLPLAQAEEHSHHLLERVTLEVEEHEKKLGAAGGQRALEPTTQLALARAPIVRTSNALSLPRHVKGCEQPLELARIKTGQRTQQLGFAENALHVHACSLPNRTIFCYPQ